MNGLMKKDVLFGKRACERRKVWRSDESAISPFKRSYQQVTLDEHLLFSSYLITGKIAGLKFKCKIIAAYNRCIQVWIKRDILTRHMTISTSTRAAQ